MVELRPRRAKAAAPAEASKVEETPKAKPKTPKASKRKATEDVSPIASKKAKSVKTPAKTEATEEPVTKEVARTPTTKKGKTPVKAKDASSKETEETPAPKSAKKNKTPAKPKDTETTSVKETSIVEEPVKTPASKSKKSKTPAKSKDATTTTVEETSIVEEPEKTTASKSKKNKTPAKLNIKENTVIQETTTAEEPEKTPAPKSSKKNKTPAKSNITETVVAQEIEKTSAAKAKKDKTPAKSKMAEDDASAETDKTPATKSKKDKTPAKAKLAKDTPSKPAEQPTTKVVDKTPGQSEDTTLPIPKSAKKTPKSSKKSVSVEKNTVESTKKESAPEEDELVFSDEELDEQTKALIKTVDVEDVDGAQSGVVLFEEGQDVGKIPELSKKQKKKAQKELAASSSNVKEDTGVIYIGRLPHGFYEHEMRSYFSQFGPIRNLRVSRNKQTGRPKHFAFVEFEEASTASIVAKTMDNYLLFGHILKCSVIPKAQVHDELFKGANKRFKPVPWNKMEGKQMERPLVEDKWSRKIAKENKRRADRAKKLEALGYEFSVPQVKDVEAAKAIAAPEATKQDVEVEENTVKAIEASPAAEAEAEAEAVEDTEAQADVDTISRPAKRGRGRPPKTGATETATPNKRAKRARA